jgi:hypothetical protein
VLRSYIWGLIMTQPTQSPLFSKTCDLAAKLSGPFRPMSRSGCLHEEKYSSRSVDTGKVGISPSMGFVGSLGYRVYSDGHKAAGDSTSHPWTFGVARLVFRVTKSVELRGHIV